MIDCRLRLEKLASRRILPRLPSLRRLWLAVRSLVAVAATGIFAVFRIIKKMQNTYFYAYRYFDFLHKTNIIVVLD